MNLLSFTPGDLCSGGHDLSVDIQENSPDGTFIARLAVNGNLSAGEIHLNLTGTDLEWFQLEEKIIKLNVLPTKPLDREVQMGMDGGPGNPRTGDWKF